jgi:hypothetical protein
VTGEQAEHGVVGRQHVGTEIVDSTLLARLKDLSQEDRAQADPLPRILHDERKLRGRWSFRWL